MDRIRGYPLIFLLLLAASVQAAPFSVDNAGGRLPKDVLPIDYTVALVPNVAARTIAGRERIELQVRRATDTLQFNSLNQVLKEVQFDGRAVASVVSDNTAQLTTVKLPGAATPGAHTLSFTFTGKIEDQPHGLFAQSYKEKGVEGLLLSTQMEAADARRMFPCWDEPAFRATFELTVTTLASWATVANMPIAKRVVHGKMATTTYERTPKMPSYLIEFTAGDLGYIEARSGDTQFRVWTVRGLERNGAYALRNAQVILADYNDYFGIPYPLSKLDSIAIPGGFQGAMENWGAIAYNDQTLLLSPSSTTGDRQTIFSIQAHEMAHQWSGDLVTMAWWDDIWLNESFASWMAAKETASRNPDWKWLESEDATKESAMSADSRASSHAIQQHVIDEQQADSAFDPEITYSKGQAILQMFEAYLGPDLFRDGVRRYMKDFAYSNASTVDLWHSLDAASHQDISAVISGWTAQPGFPLVTVEARCDSGGSRTITLSQHRYLTQGDDASNSRWKVPLQIRVGTDSTPQSVLLTADGQQVAAGRCSQPLSINAGALGFFRSRYDATTLRINAQNFITLPDTDRFALLNDQWAMSQTGAQPLSAYLAFVEAIGPRLNSRTWIQIADAIDVLDSSARGTSLHASFAAYGRKLLKSAYDQLGWDAKPVEPPDVLRMRRFVIRELGDLDDPGVVQEARIRFDAFLKKPDSMTPDDQRMILPIIARHADAATFAQLHAVAKTAANETEVRRFYGVLMQVSDPALAAAAGQFALSQEIPAQADALRLELVMQLADLHPQLSWDLLKKNIDQLMKPFAMQAGFLLAQYIPEQYWQIPPDEVEKWVRPRLPPDATNAVRGLETARFLAARKAQLNRELGGYLATPR